MEFTSISLVKRNGYSDVYIYYTKDGKRLLYPTHVKVDSKHITKKGAISESHPKFHIDIAHIKKERARIEAIVQDYHSKYREKATVEYIQEKLSKPIEELKVKRDSDLIDYLEAFRTYKTSIVSEPKSVNPYKSLQDAIEQYIDVRNRKVSFEYIDQEFISDFSDFLLNEKEDKTRVKKKRKGLNNNTVALRLKHLVEVLKWCKLEKDIQLDLDKIKHWTTTIKKKQGIKSYEPAKIIMEQEEIDYLYSWDKCEDSFLKFRDVFVFCCKNGMRISDNNSIQKYHLLGEKLKKNTKKTGTSFHIELDEISMEILKRYDYNLSVCVQDYNRDLKVILKEFFDYYKFIYESKYNKQYPLYCYKVKYVGKKEVVEKVHKADMFASHNARATSITLKAKSKLPLHQIMESHGHTDMRTTLRYIHENNIDYDLG